MWEMQCLVLCEIVYMSPSRTNVDFTELMLVCNQHKIQGCFQCGQPSEAVVFAICVSSDFAGVATLNYLIE